MEQKAQIGVRYCGGCNPRFDRVALVKRLASFFPQADFPPAAAGTAYDAVLVVCGCPSQCANTADLKVPASRLLFLHGWDQLLPTKQTLEKMLQERHSALSLDRQQILEILPHRPPMLFLDAVNRVVPGVEAVASYRVDPELPIFAGHFPQTPILPGIFLAEAAAQAAGVMLLTTSQYAGTIPLLTGIRQSSFRRPVFPGDQIEIHVSLLSDHPALGMATCQGQIFQGEALTADLELRLALRQASSLHKE